MIHSTKKHSTPGFTLIELTTSLVIMSILMLGLSGAVMISSHAIPTLTETGLADQAVIDALNELRVDLSRAATIHYSPGVTAKILTLTIKSTGTPGEPSAVTYTYNASAHTLRRKTDTQPEIVLISGVDSFAITLTTEGSDARSLLLVLSAQGTLQRTFDMQALMPDKPGVI